MMWIFSRCAGVSVKPPDCAVVAESALDATSSAFLLQPAATNERMSREAVLFRIFRGRWDGRQGRTDGALEIGSGCVGCGECVGVLRFCIEESAARFDHFERGRSADCIRCGCSAKCIARSGKQLVADVSNLAKRSVSGRVRDSHFFGDGGAKVALSRCELSLPIL